MPERKENTPGATGAAPVADTASASRSEDSFNPTTEETLSATEIVGEVDASGPVVAADEVDEADVAVEDVDGADAYMGFQDTVSVSTESFPATVTEETPVEEVSVEASTPPQDVLGNRTGTEVTNVISEAEYYEASVEASEPPIEATPVVTEDTAVLRRSLLEPPVEAAAKTLEPKRIVEADFQETVIEGSGELEGGTVLPTLASRARPRLLSAFITILLTPVMWYLLSDAAARLAFADDNPMISGVVNPAALAELGAGLLVVVLVAILAAQSSIGLFLAGAAVMVVGVPFLAAPAWTEGLFDYLSVVENFNAFGANVVAHLRFTGFTGILVMAGFALIAAGWALASVRRQGRKEEAMRVEVAKVNPAGLKARWARKATEKSYNS